jgi:hypothetical protein
VEVPICIYLTARVVKNQQRQTPGISVEFLLSRDLVREVHGLPNETTYEQLKLDEIGIPHYPFIRRLMPDRAHVVFNASLSAAFDAGPGLEQPGYNPVGCNPAPQDACMGITL